VPTRSSNERPLVALPIWFCASIAALAQNAARLPLVGVMRTGAAADNEPFATLFREELAALGDVEGRNLRLDFRFADGDTQRFPEVAEEFVKQEATVIVVFSQPAACAAQRAMRMIPIVAVADDLVASGVIQSMATPGGNTTGVSILATELDAKKLEILKEIVPAARRFGLLRDPASSSEARLKAIARTAQALGVELQTANVEQPADFTAAFASLREGGAEALDILASPLLANFQHELGRLSLKNKLPAICQFREMVEAGCLASYGVERPEMYAMVAAYIDRMLKGAKPGETVAQQPSAVELVINLKVARQIGIEIPSSVLARADEVIE